ncbi:MAG: 50S ribosomal protein L22 [Armatimonadetes bacterium]|nr:50S ribosomal protein L22 [Armatimonadota bacterium]
MEVRAVAKYVRVQPRKVRQVANEVRGKSAVQMANVLRFHPSKGAFALRKVLISAIANAEENHNLNPGNLRISEIRIDEGPKMKRMQARAMGRGNRIVKRTSHITVVVEEGNGEEAVKPHGTKAKGRPTLAGKKAKGKKAEAKKEVVEEVKEEVVEEVATTEEAPVEEVTEETTAEATAEATSEESSEEDKADKE